MHAGVYCIGVMGIYFNPSTRVPTTVVMNPRIQCGGLQVGHHAPQLASLKHDQSQPGHIVWIQSDKPSGYLRSEIRYLRVRDQPVALRYAVKQR